MFRRLRERWHLLLVAVLALCLVAGVSAGVYLSTPYPDRAGVAAVEADPAIAVSPSEAGWVMRPANASSSVALVFYPGARVSPESYLPVLAPLVAERNVTVVVPSMPLNLAVLDADAADEVVEAHPAVDRWAVGGHSLGGAMACRYAAERGERDERVEGLVLLGAYCDVDVSTADLAVVSVVGERDTVVDRGNYRRGLARLPEDAIVAEPAGVNHSQLGSYTGQSGDAPGTVSYERAHERVAAALLAWYDAAFTPSGAASRVAARPA
ncbi:alpha/beta fold hydrolase [Halomarina ordinaria]|uniref:Alpha/beta fold hydrolase n=1 Tax=Halomarina ordinaria TaxID=3033939 RepID=A0ABD5UBC6_9EURY|nr:alpha/beta fold hydrolase [Halomarina sp. PSRA2]